MKPIKESFKKNHDQAQDVERHLYLDRSIMSAHSVLFTHSPFEGLFCIASVSISAFNHQSYHRQAIGEIRLMQVWGGIKTRLVFAV